jgi:dihydrolipoamide dehydrogenase
LIGAGVTEMINAFSLAITMEATEEDLQGTVFPHPTMSEAILEAALDADGRAINM